MAVSLRIKGLQSTPRLRLFISHLFKNCYKTDYSYSKFGTDKQHIKANFHTKFCMNLINVQGDITIIFVKIVESSFMPTG